METFPSSDVSLKLNKRFEIAEVYTLPLTPFGLPLKEILNKDFFLLFNPSQPKEHILEHINKRGKWNGFVNLSSDHAARGFCSLVKEKKNKDIEYYVFLFFVEENDFPTNIGELNHDLILPLARQSSLFFWFSEQVNGKEFLSITENIENVTGYNAAAVKAFPGSLLFITAPEDAPELLREWNAFIAKPLLNSLERSYRIIDAKKSIRWVRELISVARSLSGEIERVAAVVFDITESKSGETALHDTIAGLEQTRNSYSRLINILSHDLRAPFSSLLGFAEILLNVPDLPPKEQIEYLTYIYNTSQEQLQFIHTLLEWSRLNTGSTVLEMQRTKASALVYNAVSMVTGAAIRKNVDIHVDMDDDLFVQADYRLIDLAIQQLLNNAIKYSFEGGVVEVLVSEFSPKLIEIVVRDEGIGISTAVQDQLLKVEKVSPKPGTSGERGNGFGLTLVSQIIKKHNGQLWFYSNEGHGSEFHFTLPTPSNIILLVAQDESERENLARIINNTAPGFELFSVENGYEGLDVFQKAQPNIIITNHDLPLMDGIRFIEAVQPNDASLRIPIIVIGEDLSLEHQTRYLSLGTRAFLKKPVDENEFTKTLLANTQ